MALRRWMGFSEGELSRADCKPCSRLMRHTAGIFTFGGGMSFWILCRLHYGIFPTFLFLLLINKWNCLLTLAILFHPSSLRLKEIVLCFFLVGVDGGRLRCPRITIPRTLRWAACGAVSVSSTSALLVRLFSPECEPQNIAAFDKGDSAFAGKYRGHYQAQHNCTIRNSL
ncbi:hypothetical protein IFM89_004996 [Coptis chinensis]|uniref:DUF7875 domain-containing protein n=1 Tax=Coptis chinensis TaxID=261450 RepID=A0A835LPL2_9MAGN|nr:hypothetical protein IFM89_004996 [Coptis chinensis]